MIMIIEDLDAEEQPRNCRNCNYKEICPMSYKNKESINDYFDMSMCKKWKFKTPSIKYETQDIDIIRKFYELVKEVNK